MSFVVHEPLFCDFFVSLAFVGHCLGALRTLGKDVQSNDPDLA